MNIYGQLSSRGVNGSWGEIVQGDSVIFKNQQGTAGQITGVNTPTGSSNLIQFNANANWSGETSSNGGSTSKPATVAFMWILRFI